MTAKTSHERILGILRYIQKNPAKKEVNYFTFDTGLVFMVAGKKVSFLPKEYAIYYGYDEFWLQFDAEEKKAMFYACVISDYRTGDRVKQVKGFIQWDKIEANLLTFLLTYLKELTGGVFPYSDLGVSSKEMVSSGPATSADKKEYGPAARQDSYSHTNSLYSGDAYKERSAFYDKLYDMVKDGRSSIAIDFSNEYFTRMCGEKRFEELDIVFRILDIDKLNIPLMLEILNVSKGLDNSFKERKEFRNKVEARINKAKPISISYILSNMETSSAN